MFPVNFRGYGLILKSKEGKIFPVTVTLILNVCIRRRLVVNFMP
jgi:hypothetical protein